MYSTTHVDFHGQPLIVAIVDGQCFVAMKPVVKGMGLDWRSQQAKLRASQRYHTKILPIQTKGGIQNMLCLMNDELDTWYYSINPAKTKKIPLETEYRDNFVNYLIIQGWTVKTETRVSLGRIDIYATSNENEIIIECKLKSRGASSALGQLLFYKYTYPKAQLVFACQQRINSERKSIFESYNILVVSSVTELFLN